MSEIKDGGAAFPTTGTQYNIDRDEFEVGSYGGMSLRDYFAAAVLQGIMGNRLYAGYEDTAIAKDAYGIADAMLAQRGKP